MSMIAIGADPELFVSNKSKEIIPVCGLLGGTKTEPRKVSAGAVQEDNVLAEFNIDPASTPKEFINNIKEVRNQLNEILYPNYTVVQASHEFEQSILINSGEQAMRFGCDPDINAWTGEFNDPASPYTTLRSAGGHLHLSYDNPSIESNLRLGRIMDLLIGIGSMSFDKDNRRRQLYGKAGAIRHKPYGVEYRVPSNAWLGSEELIEWAWYSVIRSYELFESNEDLELVQLIGEGVIQSTINNSDYNKAHNIMRELNIYGG